MADRVLINSAEMDGNYGGVEFRAEPSTEASVTLTNIPFTKTANHNLWLDGELTYTLTINNSEGTEALTGVIVRDSLDTTMFAYSTGSVVVAINGTVLTINTSYTVNYTAPLLTVTFLVPIPATAIATISFRGTKVPETP